MEFSLKELVAKAHMDYIGPHFPSWWLKNKDQFELPSLGNVSYNILSGKKYFMSLKVADKDGNQFEFPNEPLVQLSRSKTIVETAMVGETRIGTVKEYINLEDWQITIRGVCFDPANMAAYPADQVQEITRMFNYPGSIEVKDNLFFELFGIRNIVLKDLDFEEMAGVQGMQKYTVKAVTDNDFFAILSDRGKANDMKKKEFLS